MVGITATVSVPDFRDSGITITVLGKHALGGPKHRGVACGVAVVGLLAVSHYDDDRVSLVDVDAGTVWSADSPAYPFGSVVV